MRHVVIGAHLRRDDVEPLAAALPCGELFLSAVVIEDDQPTTDRDLLLRVARVRGALLDRATFVAIRYGLFVADAAEAAAKCAAHLPRWQRLLESHRHDVELTLKAAAASPRPRPDRADFSSGAAYLRALHEAAQASSADPIFRDAAERLLVPLALRHRWLHRDEKSVELVMLAARERVDELLRGGEVLRAECPHVPFLLSGPWPLEVFADADE
ncbi:MAG TPA: GvpL/GvpF family gas vesicle protein [Thermoanaerobaculia bacterium]|jgi:hypothetical protein